MNGTLKLIVQAGATTQEM